jgi:hypothetical protein
LPGAASGTADSKVHIRKLVGHAAGDVDIGHNRFAATDTLKSHGRVVGYEVGSGRFFVKQERIVIRGAMALRGGIILARLTQDSLSDNFRFSGPITGGTGKYKGIKGTIRSHSAATTNDITYITLRFHF